MGAELVRVMSVGRNATREKRSQKNLRRPTRVSQHIEGPSQRGLKRDTEAITLIISRLGPTAVSTVSTRVRAPAFQARSRSASVRCRFFHT